MKAYKACQYMSIIYSDMNCMTDEVYRIGLEDSEREPFARESFLVNPEIRAL